MTEYPLYVESGPRRRKTMVHVLDLLGCMVQEPTTEEALEAAPDAVRFTRRKCSERVPTSPRVQAPAPAGPTVSTRMGSSKMGPVTIWPLLSNASPPPAPVDGLVGD
ncbi:MAG: hypothetical protein EXR48_04115 [Dehalococcoidia bacterium]|nr:hypothetical protein [Dehalococcoidia bacterium]